MTNLPTVCFLTGTLNAFAGAERMTAVIANALAERGYRVFVLSLWDRASVFPLHEGVEHHALFDERPSFKRKYFSTVLGIRRFVHEHEIDVLTEVDTMLTLFTLPATLGMKVRRIAWEHCHFDEDLGRRARRVARWLASRGCEAVVVLTERDKLRWQTAHGRSCRIEVIANPLPFAFPAEPASRRGRIVLAVGRLVRAKGFDVLLDAWGRLSPAHPDWHLAIAGEGEEREALETQVRKLGIGHSVDLRGATTEIERYYRDASIFCLSSRYEGFGLVLIEAMAYGLPIVSTSCEAGPKELIRDGQNGLQVPTEDSHALAAALSRMMATDGLRDLLAAQGREEARLRTVDIVVGRWIDLLHLSR